MQGPVQAPQPLRAQHCPEAGATKRSMSCDASSRLPPHRQPLRASARHAWCGRKRREERCVRRRRVGQGKLVSLRFTWRRLEARQPPPWPQLSEGSRSQVPNPSLAPQSLRPPGPPRSSPNQCSAPHFCHLEELGVKPHRGPRDSTILKESPSGCQSMPAMLSASSDRQVCMLRGPTASDTGDWQKGECLAHMSHMFSV